MMYILINFYKDNMWVKNSGPIAMHESYKSNVISYKNTFGVKRV